MDTPVVEATTEAQEETVVEQPKTVPITSIDQVMGILMGWHQNRMQRLQHLMQIPVGTPFTDQNGKERVMEGDLRDGVIAGLIIARSEFGQLPFQVQVESEAAPEAPVPDAPVNDAG